MKKVKDNKIYLISAQTIGRAKELSLQNNLPWRQVGYIPEAPSFRWATITKHKNILKENLIGSFTEKEISYLTSKGEQ